jgi:hypothetical protein
LLGHPAAAGARPDDHCVKYVPRSRVCHRTRGIVSQHRILRQYQGPLGQTMRRIMKGKNRKWALVSCASKRLAWPVWPKLVAVKKMASCLGRLIMRP